MKKGRNLPYTRAEVVHVTCAVRGCAIKSVAQWSPCAGGRFYAVCWEHDQALNGLVLRFFSLPDVETLLAQYAADPPPQTVAVEAL